MIIDYIFFLAIQTQIKLVWVSKSLMFTDILSSFLGFPLSVVLYLTECVED